MKRQIDATTRMARRAARLRVVLAAALCTWLLPSAASASCRDVRILLRQGYPADEVSAALGLTFDQVSACVGGTSTSRNRAYGPAPQGAAGPAPLGAAGPAPLGAAGPAPLGAAGPAPRGAAGPAPLGAAGPAPGH